MDQRERPAAAGTAGRGDGGTLDGEPLHAKRALALGQALWRRVIRDVDGWRVFVEVQALPGGRIALVLRRGFRRGVTVDLDQAPALVAAIAEAAGFATAVAPTVGEDP